MLCDTNLAHDIHLEIHHCEVYLYHFWYITECLFVPHLIQFEHVNIYWLADTLDTVRGFDEEVRKAVGSELRLIQTGEKPIHARPMKTVGRGVWEIKVQAADGQFRLFYLVKRGDGLYVLHAFRKTTRKTPKKEIDLARQRLKEI